MTNKTAAFDSALDKRLREKGSVSFDELVKIGSTHDLTSFESKERVWKRLDRHELELTVNRRVILHPAATKVA